LPQRLPKLRLNVIFDIAAGCKINPASRFNRTPILFLSRENPMKKKEAMIHLLAATVATLISAIFVISVSSIQTSNARCLGIEAALPYPTMFYATYSLYGLAVPVFLFIAGLLCLRQENRSDLVLTVVCYMGWLFALAWALGCIFFWQLPYVEICPELK
jgi:hypothetical protein